MVLKKDPALFGHPEIFPFRIFTPCNQGVVDRRTALVFHNLVAVQPVLDTVIRIYNDTAGIPRSYRARIPCYLYGWYKVIERSYRAIPDHAFFCVRMLRIIEDLILKSDSGSFIPFTFGDEIFHAAVGALGEAKLELKVKRSIFFFRNDV